MTPKNKGRISSGSVNDEMLRSLPLKKKMKKYTNIYPIEGYTFIIALRSFKTLFLSVTDATNIIFQSSLLKDNPTKQMRYNRRHLGLL